MSLGIYIHWPYCRSKCPYCDFYKQVCKNVPQDEIVSDYLKELDYYHQLTSTRKVGSIFFGGGTPSLMEPKQISRLIDYIAKQWSLDSKVEISLEANPNSDYPQMFQNLHQAGINRLSLGVQALNDEDLRFLGRTHNLKQAYQAIDEVLQNFDNHSIDLIYARPKQILSAWEGELKQAVALGFKHISLYQLTIEEGTVFAKKGILPLDEDLATEMYLLTEDILAPLGYHKYEVSNYAQAGFESKHNLLYWTGGEYIGVGPSAHGRLTVFNGNLKQNSGVRNSRTNMYAQVSALRDFTLSSTLKTVKPCPEPKEENLKQNSGVRNSRTNMYAQVSALRDFTLSSTLKTVKPCPEPKEENLKQNSGAGNSPTNLYAQKSSNLPVFYATTYRCQLEEISPAERAEELLLMGLRLVQGIDKSLFFSTCGLELEEVVNQQKLAELIEGGWLINTPTHLKATKKGFPVLNFLIEQLVSQ